MEHLDRDELVYEAVIRGIAGADACTTRTLLSKVQGQVALDESGNLQGDASRLNPTQEILTCNEKAESLLVFVSTVSDISVAVDAANARLEHLFSRLARLQPNDPYLRASIDNVRSLLIKVESTMERRLRSSTSESESVLIPSISSDKNCSVNKSVPVYKWNLRFSGETPASVGNFLERVEELRVSRNVSHSELFVAAVELFEGNALTWFRAMRQQLGSWSELVNALKQEYVPVDFEDQLWESLRSRMHREGEGVGVYFAEMLSLFSRLTSPASEAEKVKLIRKNLAPTYITQLALTSVGTVVELKEACHRIENAHIAAEKQKQASFSSNTQAPRVSQGNRFQRNFRNSSSVNRVRVNSTETTNSPVKSNNVANQGQRLWCWNCGKPGHLFRRCFKPRVEFCQQCGDRNHVTANCPKNAKAPGQE